MVTPLEPPPSPASKETQKKTTEPGPKTSNFLTREESARLLDVSVGTIKTYEARHGLNPVHDLRVTADGREQLVVVYDPRQLIKIREAVAATKDSTEDTSNWYTRNDAAEALGISIQTLKNYETRGLLHPRYARRADSRNYEQTVVVYSPKELARVPRGVRPFTAREDGEMNARCNEMFEQGVPISQIVIKLRQTSDRIRALHEKWLDDSAAALVISPEAKKELEKIVGPFNDVTDLVTLVKAKLKATSTTTVSTP